MKKFKKTYAIYNLTEKHTSFFLGKTRVQVSFTGGMVSKKGVTPATFTTEDPVVQFAIENSTDFKNGAITLRSKYPTQGEVRIGKNPRVTSDKPALAGASDKPEENPEPSPESNAEESEATTQEEPGVEETISGQEETENVLPKVEEAEESQPGQEEAPAKEEGALEAVEVSCKDVAKQYLQEHFGENPAPLRTIANVQECAAKYGITFIFT